MRRVVETVNLECARRLRDYAHKHGRGPTADPATPPVAPRPDGLCVPAKGGIWPSHAFSWVTLKCRRCGALLPLPGRAKKEKTR